MKSDSSFHLLKSRVTIFVIALHGIAVWFASSIDNNKPLITEPQGTQIIQLELIDAVAMIGTESASEPFTQAGNKAEPNSKLEMGAQSEQHDLIDDGEDGEDGLDELEATEQIDSVQPASELNENKNSNDQNADPISEHRPADEDQLSAESTAKDTDKLKKMNDPNDERGSQSEVLSSREPIDESGNNLSMTIQNAISQYNQERNSQSQSRKPEAFWRQVQQDRRQIQATDEAIEQIFELATRQAEDQKLRQAKSLSNKNKSQSNQPVRFSVDQGDWAEGYAPETNLPLDIWRRIPALARVEFEVVLMLRVDKKGNLMEVELLESSGHPIIDAAATIQVWSAKLEPLQHNGQAVEATVPMSLIYVAP